MNPDHHTTIRVNTRRLPMRSAHQAVGISKQAYARVKALKTYPIWIALSPRSRVIAGASIGMQTRSRYVIPAHRHRRRHYPRADAALHAARRNTTGGFETVQQQVEIDQSRISLPFPEHSADAIIIQRRS